MRFSAIPLIDRSNAELSLILLCMALGIYILQKFKGGPINPQYAQFIHLGNDGTGLPRRSSFARTIILG